VVTVNRNLIASARGKKLANELVRWLDEEPNPSDMAFVLGILERRSERSQRTTEAMWVAIAVGAAVFAVWIPYGASFQLYVTGGGVLVLMAFAAYLTVATSALQGEFDAVFDKSTQVTPTSPIAAEVTVAHVGRWRIVRRSNPGGGRST